jgi:hypothetical protein
MSARAAPVCNYLTAARSRSTEISIPWLEIGLLIWSCSRGRRPVITEPAAKESYIRTYDSQKNGRDHRQEFHQ